MNDEYVPDVDLGDDHFLVFTHWAPDDLPANRQWLALSPDEPMPAIERWGAFVRHYRTDASGNPTMCEGAITFDGVWQRRADEGSRRLAEQDGRQHHPTAKWTVECADPLTLSPSLLCHCGDHGFVRNGKWVRA